MDSKPEPSPSAEQWLAQHRVLGALIAAGLCPLPQFDYAPFFFVVALLPLMIVVAALGGGLINYSGMVMGASWTVFLLPAMAPWWIGLAAVFWAAITWLMRLSKVNVAWWPPSDPPVPWAIDRPLQCPACGNRYPDRYHFEDLDRADARCVYCANPGKPRRQFF